MQFSSGGLVHFAVLVGVLVAAWGIGRVVRGGQGRGVTRWVGIGLALVEIHWYFYCFRQGWVSGIGDLPLHLCDITFWLTVWLLFQPRPAVYDIAYYWVLAGTTMALLTPDVELEELSYPVIHFFLAHGAVVACILGVALGGILRPRPDSWKKAWVYLNGYAVLIMIANSLLKTNFMYLSAKPTQPSLLDYFGPWPWYILPGDALALVLFWLLYLPWRRP